MGNLFKQLALAALLFSPVTLAAVSFEPTLRLAAEERYDDDALLRTQTGQGQLMTKLSPQAGVRLTDETLQLKSWYAVDLWLRHGTGTTNLDHRAELDLRRKLSRQLKVDTKAQIWRVSDPTSLPRLGLAREVVPILYGKAQLGLENDFSERWRGRVGYRFEAAQVYLPGRAAGFAHSPYTQAWWKATRRTELGGEYRYQLFTFGTDISQSHGIFAGYRHRVTRDTNFTAQAGPVFFRGNDGTSGVLPRLALELLREGEQMDLGVIVGHDLVGASGFTSAVWADFASLIGSYHFTPELRVFAQGSIYRNGRAPNVGVNPFDVTSSTTTQGYAVGGGAEWRFIRNGAVQAAVDRISQVGTVDTTGLLTRNIAALRLVFETL
ncbi:MAG: hypothetical protein ACT4TC_21590 [Myxococcaceae bacterium]